MSDYSMGEYKTIDCNLYDVYVLYIMQKKNFRLEAFDQKVIITDIFTRDKEEFISLSNGMQIRLDKIEIKDDFLIIL